MRSNNLQITNKKVLKITFFKLKSSCLPDTSEEEQACIQKIN